MKSFYNIISIIFMPLLMPLLGMIIILNLGTFSYVILKYKIFVLLGTLLFTVILPAIPIFLLKKRGGISDWSISNKDERTVPYLFSFLAFVFWAVFLYRHAHMPSYVVAFGVGSAISIFIAALINLKWKISAHLIGMGGLLGGVFGVCYQMALNPIVLFIALLFFTIMVGLARIELKAHTPSQTLAGFILGFLSVFLCSLFF